MPTVEVNLSLAFVAGLASFLAPCVLPLVPAYLGYLSGYTVGQPEEAAARRGHVVAHALAFVLGFSLIFVLLGTAAGALGRLLRGDWLRWVGGGVMIVFGLSLTGLLHVPLFDREARFAIGRGPKWGLASSVIAGLAFGAGWSPCIGPVLASILVLSADQATALQGALLLVAYSAGLGLPFIVVGLLIDRAGVLLARIAPYQSIVERAIGVVIIVVGIVLISDGFTTIGYWLEQRGIGWELGI
ncbi:MAG: cytochrome c biogenesis CcdA family protein [Anaerolineae bacterium]